MVWELLFYAGIGSLAGFFAGLLGIGGGLIIVPLLIILLTEKFSDAYAVQMSVATSLAVIVVTAGAEFSHPRQRRAGVLADCRLDADRRLCRRAACGDCSSAHSRKNCARFFNFVYVTPQLAFVF